MQKFFLSMLVFACFDKFIAKHEKKNIASYSRGYGVLLYIWKENQLKKQNC